MASFEHNQRHARVSLWKPRFILHTSVPIKAVIGTFGFQTPALTGNSSQAAAPSDSEFISHTGSELEGLRQASPPNPGSPPEGPGTS